MNEDKEGGKEEEQTLFNKWLQIWINHFVGSFGLKFIFDIR